MIPLVPALVEAEPPLGLADQFILLRLQLEKVHVELLINGAGVEQKLVSGNGEQGPGQFPDTRLIEILQILRGENQRRVPLSDSLQRVADIGDGYPRGIENI